MTILRIIAGLVAILAVLGTATVATSYWLFAREIGDDIARLMQTAKPSGIVITEAMLRQLPEPAQRYFRHAGVLGRSIPSTVRLIQRGRLRSSPDAAWMAFDADETYSVTPPGFVWRAHFPNSRLPLVVGRDEYLAGEGSILMRMLAMVPVADQHGTELGPAGLMRFLNEMMWFPQAMLGPGVSITAAGGNSFALRLADRGGIADGEIVVDAEGRMVTFRSRRFNTATRKVEAWETPIASYGQLDGMQLPTSGSAVWKLPGGDFSYIELDVTSVTSQ